MANEYRVSSLGVEVLTTVPADARASLVGVEVLMYSVPIAVVSSLGVEVLIPLSSLPALPARRRQQQNVN